MRIAKEILDDCVYEDPEEILYDSGILKENENKIKELEKPISYYSKGHLDHILRGHFDSEITDTGELKIRDSFDSFLEFYGKLGYLLHVGLIQQKELSFFDYFERIFRNDIPTIQNESNDNAVIHYVKVYEFRLFTLLLYELNRLPESLKSILPKIEISK